MLDDNARAVESSGRQHVSGAAHVFGIRIHGDDLQRRALCQCQGQFTGAATEVETVALGDAGTIQDGLGSRRTRALGRGGGGRRGREPECDSPPQARARSNRWLPRSVLTSSF